jgi:hypothetical protein
MATTAPMPAQRTFLGWMSRLLRRIGFWLLVLLGPPFVVYWLYMECIAWHGRSELAAAIAETDAVDPQWRLEALEAAQPNIPDAENSWPRIVEIASRVGEWAEDRWQVFPEKQFLSDLPPNRLLTLPQQEWLADKRRDFADACEQAVALKDWPRGRPPFRPNPDPEAIPPAHVGPPRVVTSFLRVPLEDAVQHSRATEGIAVIRAILNIGASLRDDPDSFGMASRIGMRGDAIRATGRLLAMTEPDEGALRRLEEWFRAEQGENLLLAGLRGDRAMWFHHLEEFRSGRASLFDHVGKSLRLESPLHYWIGTSYLWFHIGYLLPGEEARMLRWFKDAEANARRPFSEQQPEWDRLRLEIEAARPQPPALRGRIATQAAHQLRRGNEMVLNDQAAIICLRTAIAAERYRKVTTRWPVAPEDLVPAYLPEVPRDPAGPPLVIRPENDGLSIESATVHVGNKIAFRLYNPDQRRLPPLPPPPPDDHP